MSSDDLIDGLRDALKHSPDNVPLKHQLAKRLLEIKRLDEAEAELKSAIALAPQNHALKLTLADAYARGLKNSAAIVVLEEVIRVNDGSPAARVALTRILITTGDLDRASREYRRAIDLDDSVADPELTAQFAAPTAAQFDKEDAPKPSFGRDVKHEADKVERPAVKFADVGGLEGLKEEIRLKIIHPIQHAELYAAYGKTIGGGILMYGPPGCGKTYIARATAGEIDAGFISVGIHNVLDMWLGKSEQNLHELFERARRNKPCVLFFDEVDALAASRTDMRTSAGRHLINQFLAELDGAAANNEGILTLAATNAPWHVDGAFRRPGRFDRVLFVPPPDAPARAAILKALLKGKPLGEIDFDTLGRKSLDLSGADLKAVVDLTIEAKLREAMKSGKPSPIVTKDLQKQVGSVKSSTREWFASAKNYAQFANHGGVYDDLLAYLKM